MNTDIYLKTKDGCNCLHIGACNGHLSLCKTLIFKHGFDVDVVNNEGWAALHFSARSGSYNLFTYLVNIVRDIRRKTSNGKNCLHIAAGNGYLNLCKMLIEKHYFDPETADYYGWTALHCSANNGSFDLFLYLLQKGCEIYCKTNAMSNVLHLSAYNGHYEICEFVLKHFIEDYTHNNTREQYTLSTRSYRSQVFYKYKTIFLHAMDLEGNTYLDLAAAGNKDKVCGLLLRYDKEVLDLLNKEDKTARDIARNNGFMNVLDVLKTEYERAGKS